MLKLADSHSLNHNLLLKAPDFWPAKVDKASMSPGLKTSYVSSPKLLNFSLTPSIYLGLNPCSMIEETKPAN